LDLYQSAPTELLIEIVELRKSQGRGRGVAALGNTVVEYHIFTRADAELTDDPDGRILKPFAKNRGQSD
jgi:hypothetical protein